MKSAGWFSFPSPLEVHGVALRYATACACDICYKIRKPREVRLDLVTQLRRRLLDIRLAVGPSSLALAMQSSLSQSWPTHKRTAFDPNLSH